jgi:hypothetical protein
MKVADMAAGSVVQLLPTKTTQLMRPAWFLLEMASFI